MRLGVGFNAFSGLEFLKPAILSIRSLSHVVTVVYSRKAITGEMGPVYMMDLLGDLKREGLVDYLIEIEHPVVCDPLTIQREKRLKYEIARLRCLHAGCSHFMGRDCDEFFRSVKLAPLLDAYSSADMVLCPVLDYVKTPLLRARGAGRLHVTAFQKAYLPYRPIRCPVLVDMSRTVDAKKTVVLPSSELIMHHMTGVRYNEEEMTRKFQGHTHYNLKGLGNAKKFAAQMSAASADTYEKVDDIFGIVSYWKNEFGVKYVK